ncbi:hypothetical protein ABZ023_28240 [Streptomyces sp. NPDC006367]|uniref:hypothetical protein n=1 Tax=unclassified Streptomyces TaxID=2593676 RepID=UPI0033A143DC
MPESSTQAATELASQYSVQVTADLERNIKEQERISGEIADLQRQLAALQHDHALLVNMQQALGITTPSAGSPAEARPAASDTVPVPAPRDSAATRAAAPGGRKRSAKAGTSAKRAAASKPASGRTSKASSKPASASASPAESASKSVSTSASEPASGPAAKAAGKPSAKKAAVKAAQPTLVELVRGHLAEQQEPRSAAEVAAALAEAHTGRTVKTTVVRTTLEGLVARNQAQRTKQGTSVYYSAPDAPEPEQSKQPEQKQEAGSGSSTGGATG